MNGLGQRVGLAADRHLALLHHLEQRGLDLRRGAVDLVGEQEVREHGAQLDVEAGPVGAQHPRADEVRRHEVGGELDARELALDHLGQRLDRQRLRQAGNALQQHVAPRQQRDENTLEHRVLADDHTLDLVQGALERLARLYLAVGSVGVACDSHGSHARRRPVNSR